MGTDRKDVVIRVEKESHLAFLLSAFLGAYNRRTDIMMRESETIINTQKEILKKMSELSDAVQSIKDDVVRIGDGVKAVLALLTQPNPDVTAAVEALKNADAGLDAAADAMEAVINPPSA